MPLPEWLFVAAVMYIHQNMAKGGKRERRVKNVENRSRRGPRQPPKALRVEIEWLMTEYDATKGTFSFEGLPINDVALDWCVERLKSLDGLRRLDLSYCNRITDAALKRLKVLPLEDLSLSNCIWITDAGVSHLAMLPLETLDLSSCIQITDVGLRFISVLPVEELNLSHCIRINDGLRHVARMPLRSLSLNECGITNADLEHLAGLPLERLMLSGSEELTDADALAKLLIRLQKLSYIDVSRTSLSWEGMDDVISDKILNINDPAELRARLEEMRDSHNRSQFWVARGVMGGPTEHGKTHLSRWLAYPRSRWQELTLPQDRSAGGTWGTDVLRTTLTSAEHGETRLPDIHLHVIDTGGHPQQLLSHANLYFANWSRAVFIICYRSGEPFKAGVPEYHLGLLSELKSRAIGARRGLKISVEDLAEETRRSLSRDDADLEKMRVVLVATHANSAKTVMSEAGPDDGWLEKRFPLLDIVHVRAWEALTGTDLGEIKRSIGHQLASLPEIRKPLPKYIETLSRALERLFEADAEGPDAPRCWSITWTQYVELCEKIDVADVENRHLWALRVLDNLGYVVAPRCHEDPQPVGMRILNPAFIQRYLYNRLLNPKPCPLGAVIDVKKYREITSGLDVCDCETLEWLMETCLVAFKVDLGLPAPGWLIPDLLSPHDFAPWPRALCSAKLKVVGFLNESTYFDFVKRHFEEIGRAHV